MFQSPSGDSLFSDYIDSTEKRQFIFSFQSPSGDSLFSDPQILWVTDGR